MAEWITGAEAARIIGCSPRTVFRMTKDGTLVQRTAPRHLPSILKGSAVRVAQRRVDAAAVPVVARIRANDESAPPPDGTWLNAPQAAEVLGVTRTRVDQLAREGRLPFTRRGNRRWFLLEHVTSRRNAQRFAAEARSARQGA